MLGFSALEFLPKCEVGSFCVVTIEFILVLFVKEKLEE